MDRHTEIYVCEPLFTSIGGLDQKNVKKHSYQAHRKAPAANPAVMTTFCKLFSKTKLAFETNSEVW